MQRSATRPPEGRRPLRIAVFCEGDLNLVDGSSVWTQAICQVLASIPDTSVTLLLKAPERRDVLTRPLRDHPLVDVVDPRDLGSGPRRLDASRALDLLDRLDGEGRFDLVLLRGANVLREAVGRGSFDGRLWAYYVPFAGDDDLLDGLVGSAHRLLCPSERSHASVIERRPEAEGKALVQPPMLPPVPAAAPGGRQRTSDGWPRLAYTGQLSSIYCFPAIVPLFEELRRHHPGAELHVAGDKLAGKLPYRVRGRFLLRRTPGLIWHRAIERERVADLLTRCDVALSLRDPSLTDSPFLSTKVLEYGAARLPILLNRAPVYEDLLGRDYPLFSESLEDALPVLLEALEQPERLAAAAETCFEASRPYSYDSVARILAGALPAAAPAG